VEWHGDTLQGFDGPALTIRNSVLALDSTPDCEGTAPFFYPDDDNTSVDVDGLIVVGGGYSFRLGVPGSIEGLRIVADSWFFGPIDVVCSLVSTWDASIVTLGEDGQPDHVRRQPCDT
jgi:hypothetical protein